MLWGFFMFSYKKYQSDRLKTDGRFRLDRNISRSIRRALKDSSRNKENHWKLVLGYTIRDLKVRLISTIPKGYTWQDYLDCRLELDHIKPIRVYKYSKTSHINFRIAWGLDNLRLLPKKINRIKGGSLNSFAVKAECLTG